MRTDKQRAADMRNIQFAIAATTKEKIIKHCRKCSTEIKLRPCEEKSGRGQFCSNKCRYAFKIGEDAANANGGAWMRGKSNPNWKHGKGYERQERYREDAVRRWRRRVFARDGYTCQGCGLCPKKKSQLNAHHIKYWSTHPELRFEISNGITLCIPCHKKRHQNN